MSQFGPNWSHLIQSVETTAMQDGLSYAIGDIHGRLDLLERAAARIEVHAAGRVGRVICLGDYVDRGPNSKGVVEFVMRAQEERGWMPLKGNHEAMMVEAHAMDDPRQHGLWIDNGGGATLRSYGGRAPAEHLAWMSGLPLMVRDDHRLFIHAGVMPGEPIEAQEEKVVLWIRNRFLEAPASELPCHIVHGHTPRWVGKPRGEEPELLPHRTNLDTMAYRTGVLAVGVFDAARPGGPVDVLTVHGPIG
jgi:serine/threonine protein phosphatase 1